MISVISELTITVGQRLFELLSIYINAEPIGGKDVAPDWEEGLCVVLI